MDTKRPRTPVRTALIGIGAVGVFALVALGARQVTAQIASSETPPAAADTAPETSEVTTTATAAATSTTEALTGPADPGPEGEEPTVTVGTPTILPLDPTPVPDVVTIQAGVVVNLDAFLAQVPTGGLAGPNDGGGSNTSPFEAPQVVDPVLGPPAQPFGVALWTEPENSHKAVILVGVNSGPEGLSNLILDFGDGTTLDLNDTELDDLADGGSVEVVHRYEPTVTPQRQTVRVTARDGSGEVKEDAANFTTRADFLVGYSPLTVTALGDCDFVGKGDFALRWNNDGRERSSSFDLGDGDSYVEEEFRVGIDGVFFGEELALEIGIEEKDTLAVDFAKLIIFAHDFAGSPGPNGFVDVLELGTHVIPYSTTVSANTANDCDVRLDFAVTVALSERVGG